MRLLRTAKAAPANAGTGLRDSARAVGDKTQCARAPAMSTIRKPAPCQTSARGESSSRIVAKRDNRRHSAERAKEIGTKSRSIMDEAAVNPIEAAKLCQAAISAAQSGFNKERRRHIAEAYAIARGLQKDEQAWRKFREDDFWRQRKKKPPIDNRKAPLLHVMVFVFNALGLTRYKRAAKYAAALKQYWTDNVPAQEVAAKIGKDGGIDKLYQASTPKQTKKKRRSESVTLIDPGYRVWRALVRLREGKKARLIIERVPDIRGTLAKIIDFKVQ
jgi:hypothetical protein